MDFYITLLIIVCLALLLWVCNYLIDDVLTSRKIKRHERELRNIAHTINKHHATPILIKDEKEEIEPVPIVAPTGPISNVPIEINEDLKKKKRGRPRK